MVGRQPHAPAAFTPRRNPWYSFLEAESTPGHTVPSVATEKIPSVTPPRIDPETVRLVAQCLKHYASPGPEFMVIYLLTLLRKIIVLDKFIQKIKTCNLFSISFFPKNRGVYAKIWKKKIR
jgi:hypothetical protein